MTSVSPAPSRAVSPADLAALLRRAHVDGAPVVLWQPWGARPDPRRLRLDARHAVASLDATNALLDVDGAMTLPAIARRAAHHGAIFPLARPLPPLSLLQACALLPYFVDAYVQQASLLTAAGDPAETPRAPRAAAGPSLLGAVCSRPPLALVARARVRVALATHVVVRREALPSARAAADRVRALLDDGRAFAVDVFGGTVLHLGPATTATTTAATTAATTVATRAMTAPRTDFAHRGAGRRPSFSHAVSLAPGDVDEMTRILDGGGRVVAAPFMGRCGALLARSASVSVSLSVSLGTVAAMTSSWVRG